ncbi:hypothetical protein HYZ99_03405 [Candidatus Peregrinibacteria bacterium]|nr:hypothetical protein [Candidatus Peregrinibacteria bacterium]
MKKQAFHSWVSATVALLVFAVSIPLTTQALFRSTPYFGNRPREEVADMRDRAVNDNNRRRDVSREYHRAIEIYRSMLNAERDGRTIDPSTLVKPDVNDPSTWDFYLDQEGETAHAAARRRVAPVSFESLSEDEQQEMRRFIRVGYCSESLAAGFYELCLSLTSNRRRTAPTGIMNDLQTLKSRRTVTPRTLNLRLQMLRENMGARPQQSTSPSRTSAPAR